MLPLLPLAAGLFAGAAAIGLLRSERARAALKRAEDRLRGAGKATPAAASEEPIPPAKAKPARKTTRRAAAAKPATTRGTRKSAKAKTGAAS